MNVHAQFFDSRLPDRFWSKVSPCPATGCWLWIGAWDDHDYGHFNINGKTERVHRVAYGTLIGPIPNGLELDHLCRVHCCVNPGHLEAVTHAENMRRGSFVFFASKTACPQGHPYDDANTYITWFGSRGCRTCQRIASLVCSRKRRLEKNDEINARRREIAAARRVVT